MDNSSNPSLIAPARCRCIVCLRFTLKRFATGRDEVWRYDRAKSELKGLPPRVIGAEKDLYPVKYGNLVAECSSMVTGHVLVVDGGFLAAWPGWSEI